MLLSFIPFAFVREIGTAAHARAKQLESEEVSTDSDVPLVHEQDLFADSLPADKSSYESLIRGITDYRAYTALSPYLQHLASQRLHLATVDLLGQSAKKVTRNTRSPKIPQRITTTIQGELYIFSRLVYSSNLVDATRIFLHLVTRHPEIIDHQQHASLLFDQYLALVHRFLNSSQFEEARIGNESVALLGSILSPGTILPYALIGRLSKFFAALKSKFDVATSTKGSFFLKFYHYNDQMNPPGKDWQWRLDAAIKAWNKSLQAYLIRVIEEQGKGPLTKSISSNCYNHLLEHTLRGSKNVSLAGKLQAVAAKADWTADHKTQVIVTRASTHLHLGPEVAEDSLHRFYRALEYLDHKAFDRLDPKHIPSQPEIAVLISAFTVRGRFDIVDKLATDLLQLYTQSLQTKAPYHPFLYPNQYIITSLIHYATKSASHTLGQQYQDLSTQCQAHPILLESGNTWTCTIPSQTALLRWCHSEIKAGLSPTRSRNDTLNTNRYTLGIHKAWEIWKTVIPSWDQRAAVTDLDAAFYMAVLECFRVRMTTRKSEMEFAVKRLPLVCAQMVIQGYARQISPSYRNQLRDEFRYLVRLPDERWEVGEREDVMRAFGILEELDKVGFVAEPIFRKGRNRLVMPGKRFHNPIHNQQRYQGRNTS